MCARRARQHGEVVDVDTSIIATFVLNRCMYTRLVRVCSRDLPLWRKALEGPRYATRLLSARDRARVYVFTGVSDEVTA